MGNPEVFLHGLQGQPAFLLAGLTTFGKLVHQTQGGLCFLVIVHIHDGIPPPSVLCQKNRSAHSYIMQYLAVIPQVRNGFDIWHIDQLLSPIVYPILL